LKKIYDEIAAKAFAKNCDKSISRSGCIDVKLNANIITSRTTAFIRYPTAHPSKHFRYDFTIGLFDLNVR